MNRIIERLFFRHRIFKTYCQHDKSIWINSRRRRILSTQEKIDSPVEKATQI